MNLVVLDAKCVRAHFGAREAVEARVLNVNNTAAIQANKVVMLVQAGVEAGGRARVAAFGHQAEGNEGV